MSAPPDLEAYFARIGYDGPRAATPEVLAAIQRHHVYAVPFENLDVLQGRPARMDLASIQEKIVRRGRGGYCFEQNTLLHAVLAALGFRVTPLFARVRWQVPDDVVTPLTHLMLRVEAGGHPWLIDVGFGSASLTAPLRLDVFDPQPTPHEPRRIDRRDGGRLVQQTLTPHGEWADIYAFTLDAVPSIDFEVSNWWTSTHPASRFTRNLLVALAGEGVRWTIFNHEFTTRWTDGRVEKRALATQDELQAVLAERFRLPLPAGVRIDPPAAPWPP